MNQTGEQKRDDLRRAAQEQVEHITALRKRVDFLTARERELEAELEQTHAKLAGGDAKVRALADAAIHERDRRLALLEDQLRAANQTIQMMQSTRIWRVGHSYWRVRTAVKRLLGRA
jgi:uncharacterized coiled-coil DUF342 family protein